MSGLSRAALALLALLAGGLAAAEPALQPFRARYALALRGVPVGEALVQLDIDADGRYRMRARSQADAALKLLLPDRLADSAEGHVGADGVAPLHYTHERSGGSKREFTEIAFDHGAGEVQVQSDEGAARLPLRPGMFDPLSLQLYAMWSLRAQRPLGTVTLVDDASPDAYAVTEQGHETVDTGLGRLDAVKLLRGKPGDRKLAAFWFAPAHGYLPVQVQQWRKGRETLRMTLLGVSSGTP